VVSFRFQIIKPNLQFTKLNNQSDPNFQFWDFEADLEIEKGYYDDYPDDYYIEVKHKDFDLLSIQIYVTIDNVGMTEVDIDNKMVWLNITHEDEYGDTIYDVNLTAMTPTSTQTIGKYENTEFTFLWDFIDQKEDSDPVEYTCTITVDPQDDIFETSDEDNTANFEILIKHKPRPKKKGGGSTPGFESVLMVAAFALVILGLMITNRRRKY
jgi:hypothetical protein